MNLISSSRNVADCSVNRASLRAEVSPDGLLLPGINSGLELEYPARAVTPVRLGHTPFLFWLVDAFRPRVAVELGVGTGNSYCALLQAALQLGFEVRCFGVAPCSGSKGEQLFRDLSNYHDPLYGAFSTLLRSSHEEAVSYCADGSVDLLQIDGERGHEAISDDLKTWLPKMTSRGIVMLYDISTWEEGHAAWCVWEDLQATYPAIEFVHTGGLGVVYVGTDPLSGVLEALFDRTARVNAGQVRTYFARLGISVQEHFALGEAKIKVSTSDPHLLSIETELARGLEARHGLEAWRGLEAALRIARMRTAEAVAERDRNMHALRQQMALVSRLRRESVNAAERLQQMYRSNSWRLTAPLRLIVSKFK